jgi:hypothetical protein
MLRQICLPGEAQSFSLSCSESHCNTMRVRGFSRRLSKPILFAGLSAGAYSFSSPRLPTPGIFGASSSLPHLSRTVSVLRMATTTAATLPSWADLAESSAASPVGKALNEEVSLRSEGKGSASRENTLRKFGQEEEPVGAGGV